MTARATFRVFLTLALSTVLTNQAVAKKEKAAAPAAAATAATTLKVDPKTSMLKWIGSKATGSAHDGTLSVKSGQVEIADNTIKGGQFELDMKSIANNDLKDSPDKQKKLIGHLNSEDFFNTAQFPTSTFKITSIKALKPAKAGDATHEITGDLTIKGKSNPITFPAIVTMKPNGAEATANFAIDRTKWDVRYGSGKFFENLGDKLINDDIKMDLKLIATK